MSRHGAGATPAGCWSLWPRRVPTRLRWGWQLPCLKQGWLPLGGDLPPRTLADALGHGENCPWSREPFQGLSRTGGHLFKRGAPPFQLSKRGGTHIMQNKSTTNHRTGSAATAALGTLFTVALAASILFVFAGAVFWGAAINPVQTVEEGHVGVKTSFGAVTDDGLDPGIHPVIPGVNNVIAMNVRQQTVDEDQINVKTTEGLDMTMDVTVRYNAEPDRTGYIFQQHKTADGSGVFGSGSGYIDTLIKPTVRTEIRSAGSNYDAERVYSETRDNYREEIKERIESEIEPEGFNVRSVQLRNVELPKSVERHIAKAESMKYKKRAKEREIEVEKAEAKRKKEEAKGVKAAEEELSQVFESDDAFLQYIFITEALANTDATHPIYVPMGNSGLKMFKDIDNIDQTGLQNLEGLGTNTTEE